MNLKLLRGTKEHIVVLQHLMQFYMYDFSIYTNHDVGDNGLFEPYPGLESYWNGGNTKFPYIIKRDDKYIGFALVKFIEEGKRSYFSIAEFFILRKYRLEGAGKAVAFQLFALHKGSWEVYQMNSNKPAHLFWIRIITEFTNGKFENCLEDGRHIQRFAS